MTGTIIALRSKLDEMSAFAGFDAVAAELLADGRASNLSAARLDAILMRLHAQRSELGAIIADLEARAPDCDARIGSINADLYESARGVLAQIELFIQQAEICRTTY